MHRWTKELESEVETSGGSRAVSSASPAVGAPEADEAAFGIDVLDGVEQGSLV